MRNIIQIPGIHVGEIGLDNYKSKVVPKSLQELFFRKQLQIALEFNKVVNVHCVSAFGKLIKLLQEETSGRDIKIILHS